MLPYRIAHLNPTSVQENQIWFLSISNHDPPCRTRARDEVHENEGENMLHGGLGVCVCNCVLGKVDHMYGDVDEGLADKGPGDCLVQGEVLVEGDKLLEWVAPEGGM
jgi:hypothetical protein